jgi:pilus assembly protein CpaE
MADRIRVLIVDDIPETRDHLTKLLGFESDIEVVGAAASGAEALDLAATLNPAVVLMDINMPGMDGIATTEQLSSRFPQISIVMMSVQGEADYLRRSMLAGAREFLVKPFSADELVTSIRQVYAREREKLGRMVERAAVTAAATGDDGGEAREAGRIVTVFSPKGGVGRTTIAVNLGVAAASELGKRVCIVDGSFQFGDVGVLLNLNPKNKSIADVIQDGVADLESLESVLVNHSSTTRVLLAPPSPEMAELVTPSAFHQILEALRLTHDLVVVDSWTTLNEATLDLLDLSDEIVTLMTLEITNIKNVRLFLEVADQLGYGGDKIKLVLNRSDAALGIRIADVESSIGRKIDETIVSDGRSVVYALNRGVPFVISSREAQVSQDVVRLARKLTGVSGSVTSATAKPTQKKSLFARR